MTDKEFEYLRDFLGGLTEWDLITAHSVIRTTGLPLIIKLSDVFYDIEVDVEINSNQLLAYIQIEMEHRNQN